MHNLTKIRVYRIMLYLVYPLALVFVWPYALLIRKKKARLFFLFDRYAIGGAQRIYLDVLKSVEDQPKQIFFTRSSVDTSLKQSFFETPNAEVRDIHTSCENLFLRLFTIHFYAFYLNRHKNAHVFSSNSTFFYDMLPFLSSSLTTTELFHNFAHNKHGMEFFGLANHRYLNYRFIYDNYTLNNIRKQYKEYQVPDVFLERIVFIEPGVTIPPSLNKNYQIPLKILYAGRGGIQKRVWILNAVIREIVSRNLPVEFYFAGTMQEDLDAFAKDHSTIYGPLHTEGEMYDAYEKAQVLILTSQFEGFPMVIKESMACGCIPLVTALEGNKMHLEHLKNALLIENIIDEKSVADQAINHIQFLLERPDELERLSVACFQYAATNFDRERFYRDCRALLTKQ